MLPLSHAMFWTIPYDEMFNKQAWIYTLSSDVQTDVYIRENYYDSPNVAEVLYSEKKWIAIFPCHVSSL